MSLDLDAYEAYRRQRYFPALDGLRALSVLLVITVHLYGSAGYWFWLSGRYGVTIFFVLSGYLITTLGLREEAERGRVSLAAFYVRRCCRLMPLYYLTLAAYGVVFFGLGSLSYLKDGFAQALPYYLVYLPEVPIRNIVLVGGGDLAFLHSWSLGVEEKFYLAWPVMAFVIWRGLPGRRWQGTVAATVALAAAPTVLGPLGGLARSLGQILFAYYPILVGCALAQLLHDRATFGAIQRRLTFPWGVAVIVTLLAAHFATPWLGPWPAMAQAVQVLYPVAVAGLLCVLLLRGGMLDRWLSVGPLVLVGRLSYGIYLIHMLALYAVYACLPLPMLSVGGTLLAFVLTALLSIATAWLLHLAVERPGIALGRAWSDRILRGGNATPEVAVAPTGG